ncbi:hypothetical protein JCM21900_004327 [Sporobolomyces salmonicolor]
MKVITQLRQLIDDSLGAFEAELNAHSLPDLDFNPLAHPLDNPDYLTPPKLFEARLAIEFDIATLLADASVDANVGVSATVLGKKCGVDSAKLARMLRILTSEGVFTELSEGVFANKQVWFHRLSS